jgi:hypothetical protein
LLDRLNAGLAEARPASSLLRYAFIIRSSRILFGIVERISDCRLLVASRQESFHPGERFESRTGRLWPDHMGPR